MWALVIGWSTSSMALVGYFETRQECIDSITSTIDHRGKWADPRAFCTFAEYPLLHMKPKTEVK